MKEWIMGRAREYHIRKKERVDLIEFVVDKISLIKFALNSIYRFLRKLKSAILRGLSSNLRKITKNAHILEIEKSPLLVLRTNLVEIKNMKVCDIQNANQIELPC